MKIHPVVFEIPRTEDFLSKIFKNLYEMNNFKFKKIEKHFRNIDFAYIAQDKFQQEMFVKH